MTQPCGSGCGQQASSISHDANGNVVSRTDFKGATTTYQYDLTRNLETSRTEAVRTPEERTITAEWHPSFRLPTRITEPGRTIAFTYDANGNRLTKTVTASEQSRTWSYTYNTFGQVTRVDGPRTDVADVTTLACDAQGNLSTVTNAKGHVTRYDQYDSHDRVGRITVPSGVVTEFAYDVRGRLIGRTVGGKTTTFEYDGVGQLTQVTQPDGTSLQYTYNAAHRLTDITDAVGNRIHTSYDLAGNKTKEEVFDAAGTLVRTHQWVYDGLSRLIQSIGAAGQTTTYTYDANGNRVTVTDPLGRVTSYTHDALNRVVAETDPLAGITGYSYDALDQLLAVTDPRGLTTTYTYDGFGDLLQETSPNTGTTTYTYTPYGLVASRTDARDITANYVYDEINRLIKIAYPEGIEGDQLFFWDRSPSHEGSRKGRLRQAGEISYGYDDRGNVIIASPFLRTPVDDYRPRYTYDDAYRLIGIEYLSGRSVHYQRGSDGRIRRVTVTEYPGGPARVLADDIQYAPFGPLERLTYGNGKTLVRRFDLAGRLIRQILDGIYDLNYSHDPLGQITAVVDALNPAAGQTYSYDELGWLIAATGPFGSLTYTYDATGNRQSETRNGQTTTYHYLPTDQRLHSLGALLTGTSPMTRPATPSKTAPSTSSTAATDGSGT